MKISADRRISTGINVLNFSASVPVPQPDLPEPG
jgi:hypothetical protein